MKKNLKTLLAVVLAAIMLCLSMTTVYAETIYSYNGYLYTFINNEKVSLYGLDDENAFELIVPDILNNRAVVDIRNRAFFDNTALTSVAFSNATNLERIGSFAFANCVNLDGGLVIPNTVTTIETAAFQGCSSLDSVVFDASTGYVPNQCFSGCTSLSSVTLTDTVTEIGYYAFSNCPALTYIEIPASVTSIAKSSFQNDSDITLGVYYNSYAHEYAVSEGINYIILDPENMPTEPPTEKPTVPETEVPTQPETVESTMPEGYYLGDVDGNNLVESIDATLIQRLLANLDYPASCVYEHGDVDSDDDITIIDVTLIERHLANLTVLYPIGDFIRTDS
ncbi:MAG: leucine-rich repeat domain-containing protein [Ruminococcus sp.]|nr:leucine-rich repeat domain-containing protein [Ruminococcus sp.]